MFGRGEAERLRRSLESERERREAAEEDVVRLRAVFTASPVGMVLTDRQGKPMLRNPAATIAGHTRILVDEALEPLLGAATGGRSAERRLELVGPPPRVLVLRALPLIGGGALAVIDDLSDRARLDAVRTDFVANISHELKTPVGALALLAETVAEHDDPEVMRHLAARMVEEAHRAAGTIDDLLELSRIELGGDAVSEPVDTAMVLKDAVERAALAAERRHIAVVVDTAEAPVVIGDHLQLVSALANLIDNAVKYSGEGLTVTVAARRPGRWAELSVSDQGVGIAAKDLDRIFERFYRVDRARSRETGGTGLGLAIVRHVANNHGGEVTVQSREGEGSVFTLRIPADAPANGIAEEGND